MCNDGIDRIQTAKEVLLEQLEDSELSESEREHIQFTLGALINA
jgi:hypothetical protein